MTLRWYMPRRGLTLGHLALLGVQVKPAGGTALTFLDEESGRVLCNVGDVTVYKDGRVAIWPRLPINMQRAMPALLTAAEDALLGRTSRAQGWHDRRTKTGSYWRCSVYITLPEDHALAVALRRGTFVEEDMQRSRDLRIEQDAS